MFSFSHCVLYEALLADPEGETGRMFDALDIPREFIAR